MALGAYELNQIYTGECSALMERLPDGCIDLTVTSPPYDSLRSYSGYTFDFEPIAKQLYRVTKPGGVVVWVVADETKNGSESGTAFRQALGFMAVGFNLHDTMIYEVAGTGAKGSNLAYWQGFEYMFVFSKGTPKTVNLLRDKKNIAVGVTHTHSNKSAKLGVRTDTQDKRTVPQYSTRTNIWRYGANRFTSDQTDHPAPFPEQLAHDHIISWSNPGDVVFDPMIGSGTVAKMCILTDRNFLGFEISREYTELAKNRIARVQMQPKLFPYQEAA